MASTIPRTSLKRIELTLLLIITYIFVGIKKIVACSACICKQAKNCQQRDAQTHVDIFHLENTSPYVKEVTIAGPSPQSHRNEMVFEGGGLKSSSFALFLFAHFFSLLTVIEANYRNEIIKQLKPAPDLCFPECIPSPA